MKRILGFTAGVIATSVLLSGCATSTTNLEIEKSYVNEYPFLKNIDGNSSKIHGFALTKAFTINGIRKTQDVFDSSPILIKSSDDEEISCAFVAEAIGNITTERFETRLQSASCFDKDGSFYESKNIKGYVIGADNIVGLKGNVVSTMGSMMLRTLQNDITIENNVSIENNSTVISNTIIKRAPYLSLEVSANRNVTVVATSGEFVKIYDAPKEK